MGLVNFFHHLFNPHCDFCMAEKEKAKVCSNCQTLLHLLEIEKSEKRQLVEHITYKAAPTEPMNVKDLPEAIKPRIVPWHIQKEGLERRSREEAAQLAEEAKVRAELAKGLSGGVKTIEEIEKEAGVENG